MNLLTFRGSSLYFLNLLANSCTIKGKGRECVMTKETQRVTIIYTEVERTIDFYYQMQKIATHHELTITHEVVKTARAVFTLHQVMDVSYKPFSSSDAGILYLHTNQGVFPFNIHSNPQNFIDTFRSLK
jgi:hypothetical protein